MTISDYLSKGRFPLTTRQGLSALQQLRIDALTHDAVKAYLENGRMPSAELRARWAELQEKRPHQARLEMLLTTMVPLGRPAAGGRGGGMTLTDYLDEARFPLTTRPGLTARRQLLIDYFNHDALKEFLVDGGTPDAEQVAIWCELSEKLRHNARLLAELAGAEAGR
jgi:hypothetical protein